MAWHGILLIDPVKKLSNAISLGTGAQATQLTPEMVTHHSENNPYNETKTSKSPPPIAEFRVSISAFG